MPQICAYCNDRPGVTKDHIIPRALYQQRYPPNMLTARVCEECNQEKGKLEPYFRDSTVVNMETATSTAARALAEGAVRRATERNQSEFANHARRNLQYAELRTAAGLFLGHLPVVPIDDTKIERYLELIARGLSYRLCRARIPMEYQADVRTIPLGQRASFLESFNTAEIRPAVFVQDPEVFCAFYLQVPALPCMSLWVLLFFKSVIHTIDFNPPAEEVARLLAQE